MQIMQIVIVISGYEMNAEDYCIGLGSTDDCIGAIVVLSVLLGAAPFRYKCNNEVHWYRRFKR